MFKVEFLPKITCYRWLPERPHRSTDMSSLSSTCHPLKLSIIFRDRGKRSTSEKRKKKYRDEKGCPDLDLNVPKERQTIPAESEMIKYIPGKQSWQPVLPCDWELSWTKEHTFSCWVKPIGMSDQGHWVCKRKTWIPFSCCPVSFCFWEWCFSADIPCRDVTSRKKIHLWCSLVAPSCLS